ncbi:hypothetical protein lerEdw1_012833 [Lerista edwardsae]|nr:hypothetical protein lerEdw1_012833 [Lerista edwardsae]
MMDTLAVALRVAEEAVEEAISKAEMYTDSLDKQNEACYLREHKEELIEELATTIVQKRSQSAFSLSNEDTADRDPDLTSSAPEGLWRQPKGSVRKQKEHKLSALPSWKSVDQLNEPTLPPPVLQSTDGNWVALQNVNLSRPRMLAKPKSQVFRALENESSIVSAYDEMGSDSEDDYDWNVALNKLRRKPKQQPKESFYGDSQCNTEWAYGNEPYQPTSDDLSEADISSEDQQHQTKAESMEEKLKSRLFELAAKMSDNKETSSEELASEARTELETQKSSVSSEDSGKCIQEELKKEKQKAFDLHLKLQFLTSALQQKYSAVSLCNISTEVLKVINATEELIAEPAEPCDFPADAHERGKGEFPLGADPIRLDEEFTTLEENVYLTAGGVYGLESQLNELEDAARRINSITAESELADLEDQVATAAAQVHHAELQISDIESRISALTVAGLNVAPCTHLTRKRDQKETAQMHTIDTSRQQRRKLPAPPVAGENMDASPVTPDRTFNKNFMLQGSLTQRTRERKSTAKDLMEPTIGSAVMY